MNNRQMMFILSRVAFWLGITWFVMVVIVAVYSGTSRLVIVNLTDALSHLLIPALRGMLVYPLPFGGSLRGDFIIAGVILMIISKLLNYYVDRAQA